MGGPREVRPAVLGVGPLGEQGGLTDAPPAVEHEELRPLAPEQAIEGLQLALSVEEFVTHAISILLTM